MDHHVTSVYSGHVLYYLQLLCKYINCNDDGITECHIGDIRNSPNALILMYNLVVGSVEDGS